MEVVLMMASLVSFIADVATKDYVLATLCAGLFFLFVRRVILAFE